MPDPDLLELGWKSFFSDQLSPEERSQLQSARVMAVHRGKLAVAGSGLDQFITPSLPNSDAEEYQLAVGDWLLLNPATLQISRILRRGSLFKRRAPGSGRKLQLIAANVDTVFIVASCNQDFNLARIERYLILAREVGVHPVVVLTKVDLTERPDEFVDAARGLQSGLDVEIINARDPLSAGSLTAWCGIGETVALLGSSGVGKSTLINTLRDSQDIATQEVRQADGKGRHTTTVREMHRLAQGGWLLDTPGMRELQLTDAAAGLAAVFEDIVSLAQQCKFSNCAHESEPGCEVQRALQDGTLDRERLDRMRKLTAEDDLNTLNLDEHHARPQRRH
ncbi:ribosome small subunit-dependent GTPase A [Altererythrobacter sp. Root672]|uniref:ribosome small subunit-dependent GTPase A n=1 Tax=Altererythrobacter sp. Root672 TaxID=1736584 RepID=UPI000B18E094|nr:ribosome small subunit-dependent GTPase A [Altererythrobacter sp. Root672]